MGRIEILFILLRFRVKICFDKICFWQLSLKEIFILSKGGENKLSTKLYVGNLDYDVTDVQLKEEFTKAGTVESTVVISDRRSGRSKGFGFVEMSSEDEAKKAIEMFNGKELQGRNIIVSEARSKESNT